MSRKKHKKANTYGKKAVSKAVPDNRHEPVTAYIALTMIVLSLVFSVTVAKYLLAAAAVCSAAALAMQCKRTWISIVVLTLSVVLMAGCILIQTI